MRTPVRILAAWLGAAAMASGCATALEVPIETPLKSKLDVTKFRRVLVAGFVTDLVDEGIDLAPETARLLQNQLRSASKLQIIEPDRPPLNQALAKAFKPAEDVRVTREDRDRYRAEGERILQDGAFWRKLGEEYQNPLIVTGKLTFEEQNRSGFRQEAALMRDPRTGRVRESRGNRYSERKAFTLSADFSFIDGATGRLLHKERFSEEVVYGEEQKVSPLSSYFELMDRLLPNFLGVISPQKIRGTRVLLP
ncbi:MAG: hypothetical protein KBH14_01880 [Vicinamibacteria bacterium]|jgi:hypothetical protein|nr:hypothetical protein [Vicinamibacteria bacterium]MBP9945127.1 hypothetical protein [Vicinamibacteria bacterium]